VHYEAEGNEVDVVRDIKYCHSVTEMGISGDIVFFGSTLLLMSAMAYFRTTWLRESFF
jgi:hypothetical protein